MNGKASHAAHEHALAPARPREETRFPLNFMAGATAVGESGVRQVVEAVGRCVSVDAVGLPEEFFPAHLSVAIVEAVFGSQRKPQAQSPQVAQRYSRHFGLTHRRRNIFELPPIEEQETVADLIAHYDELGVEGMANEVFEISHPPSGVTVSRADTVLHTARVLRSIGVDVLQDVQDRSVQVLEDALCGVPGADRSMARLLLTYAGDDDFVVGDSPVRRFVAAAIGHGTVSASWAAHLVRQAAYELVLSPRHLDYLLYRYGAGC